MLFNGVLALVQEGRAKATLATLKQRLAPTALVRRDGMWGKHPAADLVPGDAIRLPLGSLVPADVRLVSGAILVDQSLLTGESVPTGAGPGDVAYAGAQVRRGQAIAEVAATGTRTYFGRAAELVRLAHVVSAEQRTIFGAVRYLAAINGAFTVGIVIYAHALGLPAHELIGLALTMIVGKHYEKHIERRTTRPRESK